MNQLHKKIHIHFNDFESLLLIVHLLLNRNMKTDQIMQQFRITFLWLIRELLEHFRKCPMMNAHRNEQQHLNSIESKIRISNGKGYANFSEITAECCLIPWETRNGILSIILLNWMGCVQRFNCVQKFCWPIQLIEIQFSMSHKAKEHREHRCYGRRNEHTNDVFQVKFADSFACVVGSNQVPECHLIFSCKLCVEIVLQNEVFKGWLNCTYCFCKFSTGPWRCARFDDAVEQRRSKHKLPQIRRWRP